MPTIKELRQSGWKVRVMHQRNYNNASKLSGDVKMLSNFGGYTRIEITTPDQAVTVVGEAKCSDKENFNRRLGNSIAMGRAWNQYNQLQNK